MLDNYRSGYKKALLDILNLITYHDVFNTSLCTKTKKQYINLLKSFLSLCLTEPKEFDKLINYADTIGMVVNPKDSKVISLNLKEEIE